MIHCPSCRQEMVQVAPVEIRLAAEPRTMLVTAAVVCTNCAAISEVIPQNNFRTVEYPGLTVGHLVTLRSPIQGTTMTWRTLRPCRSLVARES